MPNVPIWLYFVAFLAVLGPLVFVHEYGHYIVGRWCGVKADTFSIGFGRKILGWTDRRGTEWKIGWLTLGGYVQFAGDRDAVRQERKSVVVGKMGSERGRLGGRRFIIKK